MGASACDTLAPAWPQRYAGMPCIQSMVFVMRFYTFFQCFLLQCFRYYSTIVHIFLRGFVYHVSTDDRLDLKCG